MNETQLLNRLSVIAAIGIIGTVYFAQKASAYRRIAVQEKIAFDTVNSMMFRAKERITDPEKQLEFETILEKEINHAAKLIKDVK